MQGRRRIIKPIPTELAGFIPESINRATYVNPNTNVYGVIEDMVKKVPLYSWQVRKVLPFLLVKQGEKIDLRATLYNIYWHIASHVNYQDDPKGVERVRQYPRLMKDKVGDCDCASFSYGCFLHELGLDFYFKMTKNFNPNEWNHVYVIVKNRHAKNKKYYVLDFCMPDFDQEYDPIYEYKNYLVQSTAKMRYEFLGSLTKDEKKSDFDLTEYLAQWQQNSVENEDSIGNVLAIAQLAAGIGCSVAAPHTIVGKACAGGGANQQQQQQQQQAMQAQQDYFLQEQQKLAAALEQQKKDKEDAEKKANMLKMVALAVGGLAIIGGIVWAVSSSSSKTDKIDGLEKKASGSEKQQNKLNGIFDFGKKSAKTTNKRNYGRQKRNT